MRGERGGAFSPPPCGEGPGVGVPRALSSCLTPLPDPPPQGRREKRLRFRRANHHHAAFAVAASDAKVLPSAASRLSSGAGSSEGSLVSVA
jgi:hypothetical protein